MDFAEKSRKLGEFLKLKVVLLSRKINLKLNLSESNKGINFHFFQRCRIL